MTQADFIIGNPPFVGGNRLRTELGSEYVEQLWSEFSNRIPLTSNLVCYFFEKARHQVEAHQTHRCGLLATNSIRHSTNKVVLERIKATGDIFMAWSDLPWIQEGASIRISIVGFDDGSESVKSLDGKPVAAIDSSLTTGIELSDVARLEENRQIAFIGVTPIGPFDIDKKIAAGWLELPVNVNGQPNSDVVKPFVNARDIVQRSRQRWIVDFGVSTTESQAAEYEAPFEYVVQEVKPERILNRRASRAAKWWLFGEPCPEFRSAIEAQPRYLVTPRVAKHRIFAWLPSTTLPGNKLMLFAREDDFFFGVLHSRAHEVWSLRMGSRHGVGNDPIYNGGNCFETFPLPWPPGQEPVDDPRVIAIGDAAKRLDDLRTNWLEPQGASDAELKKRTLTNLYNAKPTWLQNAHAALDRAVWHAYGWPADEVPAEVEEDVILSRLLELNQERAANPTSL